MIACFTTGIALTRPGVTITHAGIAPRATGIPELVRFDEHSDKQPLRVWDEVDGDLVERAPDDPRHRFCRALGLWWIVVEDAGGSRIWLSRDADGREPLLTEAEEARLRAKEADARAKQADARSTQADARAEEATREAERARLEAEQLRAELARLRGESK